MSSEIELLKRRISELEEELADRESDLARYKLELSRANIELEQLIGRLNSELKTAHVIQKALVPTEFPNIPGFEFSTKFVPSLVSGGDYYDVFELEDKFSFGFILASCSGHTMSAMLLSVLLKMARQIEARKGTAPHLVITRIAKELEPSIEPKDHADLFYALVDRRSYELTYCRAGQVAALRQNFATGELDVLEGQAASLSKLFSAPGQSQKVALSPRDRLVFCSPGILTAQNVDGEEFGQERLLKAIRNSPRQGVHEVRNQILFEVERFTSGQEPKRDRTVAVMEVKDRVIKLAK